VLDSSCRVTVTRFYRDRAVWDHLRRAILPEAIGAARSVLRIWCAGCASGEEPYTLALCWRLELSRRFPAAGIEIVATDDDERMLERARTAVYPFSALRDLPEAWRDAGFDAEAGSGWRLRPEFREPVRFLCGDVRREAPAGRFGLVLCRNLAFTYFDDATQLEALGRLAEAMEPGGILVVGRRERPPRAARGWDAVCADRGVWRRRGEGR
jgi:chemotaxis protein methyltransferase CheR